jgi:hypothetical protein
MDKRISLRPPPKFLPRTPSGVTSGLSVSGATARAPMMRAHLVEDPESPALEVSPTQIERSSAPTSDNTIPPQSPVESKPSPSVVSGILAGEEAERRRVKSLSASVSSMLEQQRALENVKATSAGKIKGGSNLKGSPAWKAERRLRDEMSPSPRGHVRQLSNLGQSSSTSEVPQLASLAPPVESNSANSSTRTSWIGGIGLLGLGLKGISTASSTNGSSTGAQTPPVRVSFAKEPVKYSEERDSMSVDEDEDENGALEGAAQNADGSLTIKPRVNSLRRTRSWNNSISGSRRVPSSRSSSKQRRKSGEKGDGKDGKKKESWLEWFINAAAAGSATSPHAMGGASVGPSNGFAGGIGREEAWESRGRDEW